MSALFLCDRAEVPADWRGKWDETVRLSTEGDRATVNFRIDSLEAALLGSLDGRSLDLIRIAALALAADQSVSRGGLADPHERKWHRKLGLVIPVNEPAFWRALEVQRALRSCLGFLSDDDWFFDFTERTAESQRQLLLSDQVEDQGAEAEVVIPFSGGIDSLTAAVETLRAGQRPLLVTHASSSVPEGHRRELLDGLRALFPGQTFGRVNAHANRRQTEAVEPTNRSRSFFFASVAMVTAVRRRAPDVMLADNGWVSVNLRINDQMVGAIGTRSTHPRFLRLFNELACLVFDSPPTLRNPFWDQTRADVIERLRAAGGLGLLEVSNSCAVRRNLPRHTPHCGRCSQCIDRRFAVEATSLVEFDPVERYASDVFTEDLDDRTKNLALSYVRAAREIDRLSDDGLFAEFPELVECVAPTDREDVAHAYVAMLRRQSRAVLDVVEVRFHGLAADLTRGTARAGSLLGLLAADQSRSTERWGGLRASADYRTVAWRGQTFTFTRAQARAVRNLHESHSQSVSALSRELTLDGTGREYSRVSDVFKRHPAWKRLVVTVGRTGYALDLSPNVA